tara:strand:- start:502 stop:669 length:168 start_codon:yes stop_codon:yes gene_type:complete
MKDQQPKIYERNPDTGVIRWRYLGEDPNVYGWPNYGNILSEEEANKLERPLNEKT